MSFDARLPRAARTRLRSSYHPVLSDRKFRLKKVPRAMKITAIKPYTA